MTMIWRPDTCDCVVEYEGENSQVNQRNIQARCNLHRLIAVNALTTVLLAHNRGFNLRFGNTELSPAQRVQVIEEKRLERERIRAL